MVHIVHHRMTDDKSSSTVVCTVCNIAHIVHHRMKGDKSSSTVTRAVVLLSVLSAMLFILFITE